MELHVSAIEAEQLDHDSLLEEGPDGRYTALLGRDRGLSPVKVVIRDPTKWSWATPR